MIWYDAVRSSDPCTLPWAAEDVSSKWGRCISEIPTNVENQTHWNEPHPKTDWFSSPQGRTFPSTYCCRTWVCEPHLEVMLESCVFFASRVPLSDIEGRKKFERPEPKKIKGTGPVEISIEVHETLSYGLSGCLLPRVVHYLKWESPRVRVFRAKSASSHRAIHSGDFSTPCSCTVCMTWSRYVVIGGCVLVRF